MKNNQQKKFLDCLLKERENKPLHESMRKCEVKHIEALKVKLGKFESNYIYCEHKNKDLGK